MNASSNSSTKFGTSSFGRKRTAAIPNEEENIKVSIAVQRKKTKNRLVTLPKNVWSRQIL
jgi:hypothetical protein